MDEAQINKVKKNMQLYISHRNQTHFDRVNKLEKLKLNQFKKRNSSQEVS